MNARHSLRSRARGLAAVAALAFLAPAVAAEDAVERKVAPEMTASRKAGRGLAGLTLGILELPGNIAQEGRLNGWLKGIPIGIGMGIPKFVVRTGVGAFELLSSPFPTPKGYEPVFEPEYPWGYFQSPPDRVYGFANEYLVEEEAAVGEIPGLVTVRDRGALIVQLPGDLTFATGSAELTPAASSRLSQLADTLRTYPDLEIIVQGYTDAMGSDAVNAELSQRRAATVRQYLVDRGVDAGCVQAFGHGELTPVASNETPAGRQANRRVELELRAGGVSAYR